MPYGSVIQKCWLLALIMPFFVVTTSANAQTWPIQQQVEPQGPGKGSWFGLSVDVDDNIAVVGAPAYRDNRGAVYIYERFNGQWSQVQHIVGPTSIDGQFGVNVEVHDGTIAIAAHSENGLAPDVGAVHVYEHDGANWAETALLKDPPGQFGRHLGRGLSLHGSTIAVSDNESVFIYQHQTGMWEFTHQISEMPLPASRNARLLVAVRGSILAVTDQGYQPDPNGGRVGAVYVFQLEGMSWTHTTTFVGQPWNRELGHSVATSETRIYVGNPTAGTFFVQATGEILVFEREANTWEHVSTITGAGEQVRLGSGPLRARGEVVLAGTQYDSVAAPSSGAAYLYKRNALGEWVIEAKLFSPNATGFERMGYGVGLSDDTILVGSPEYDGLCPSDPFCNSGTAYFFPNRYCYADCDESTGAGILDVFDFLCFQNNFVSVDSYACNCDTSTGPYVCDVFDFLCFQSEFVAGCP